MHVMTSNARPDSCLRSLVRRMLIVLLAWALAACGPGSGGTGTGPIGNLNFVGTTASTGHASSSEVYLQLQDTSVEFISGCGRFFYNGSWTVNADKAAILEGRLETGTHSVPATLFLEFGAAVTNSEDVMVTLRDPSGMLLVGPVLMSRQSGPAQNYSTRVTCN